MVELVVLVGAVEVVVVVMGLEVVVAEVAEVETMEVIYSSGRSEAARRG